MTKLRVAVLYGGRSGEHEVSLRSAESIIAAMDPRALRSPADSYRQGRPLAAGSRARSRRSRARIPDIDVVFPVLHGTFGEDGTVQGLLELADLAYVGAGVLASSVSMDKEVMKRLLVERGLAGGRVYGGAPRTVSRGRSLRDNSRFRCSSSPRISDRRWASRKRKRARS